MSLETYLETIRLNGIVMASEYNRRGRTVEVSILTDDLRQYTVITDGTGRQLFQLCMKHIEAEAVIVGRGTCGEEIVRINSYSILDES